MKDDFPRDSQLKSLEARLMAGIPLATAEDRERLLYQCAFAAGRSAGGKMLRRWQVAAALLAVLSLGLSVPRGRDRALLAKRDVEPTAPEVPMPQPKEPQPLNPLFAKLPPTDVTLDAWQAPPNDAALFDEQLAQFKRSDPELRSLTPGAMARRLLEQ